MTDQTDGTTGTDAADAGTTGDATGGRTAGDAAERAAELGRLRAWGDALVALHDGFRADLAAIRRDAGAAAPDARLGVRCGMFCDRLHEHHTEEDQRLFGHLRAAHPELDAALRRLGEQHRTLAALMGELRAAREGAASEPEKFRADLDRLAVELTRHLDEEERHLVPVLNAMTALPDGM